MQGCKSVMDNFEDHCVNQLSYYWGMDLPKRSMPNKLVVALLFTHPHSYPIAGLIFIDVTYWMTPINHTSMMMLLAQPYLAHFYMRLTLPLQRLLSTYFRLRSTFGCGKAHTRARKDTLLVTRCEDKDYAPTSVIKQPERDRSRGGQKGE